MEDALRKQMAAARDKLVCLDSAIKKLKRKRHEQQSLLSQLNKALADVPNQVYFSNVSQKPWPTVLIWEITDRCGIADKLYTSNDPALKRLIRPSLLTVMHVKHLFTSPAVARYHRVLQHWMSTKNTSYEAKPRWKHYLQAPTLRAMANNFQTKRFVVKDMTLTMLGPKGLLYVEIGSACEKVYRALGVKTDFKMNETKTGLVVEYNTLSTFFEVRYGGRHKRLVVCTRDWNL